MGESDRLRSTYGGSSRKAADKLSRDTGGRISSHDAQRILQGKTPNPVQRTILRTTNVRSS